MGLALVSVDFEARKNAHLFRQSLSDLSEEDLRGFFYDGWSYVFITDRRLGKWDPIFGKERSVVDLRDVDTITRHDKLTGPKVVATKKDGSEIELAGSWIADPDDIGLLQQIHAGSDPSDEESRRDYLFDANSDQIPLPPSLQFPQSKAAIKQAAAWEKKRAKWEAERLQKEQARFAEESERGVTKNPLTDDSPKVHTDPQEEVNDPASGVAEEARALPEGTNAVKVAHPAEAVQPRREAEDFERKNEGKSAMKIEQATKKHVAKVRLGLLPGEDCTAALGKTLATVFVSNMRVGVVKSEGQILDDVKLQDVESLRIVAGKFGSKLMLKTRGSEEVKIWSGDEAEAKWFIRSFERESASPHPLFSELLAQYDAAMEIAMVTTQKKAAPVRNWLLKALVSDSGGDSSDVIRSLEKVLAKVDSFDDFKAIVSRFVKAGQLDASYLPVEMVVGDKRWMSSGGYVLVFPKVLVVNGNHCVMSESTRAEVVEEGQDNTQYVYEGQYFTGGAALLLGRGASSKKVGNDSRKAFLVLTDAKWQQAIELHPDKIADAKKFVFRLSKRVAEFNPSVAQKPTTQSPSFDPVTSGVADELTKLKAQLDDGAISFEEYEAAKRKALGL